MKGRVENAEAALSTAAAALTSARSELQRHIPSDLSIDSFRQLTAVENIDQRIAEAQSALQAGRQRKAIEDEIKRRAEFAAFVIPQLPANLNDMLQSTLDSVAGEAEAAVREHLQHRDRPLSLEWATEGHRAQVGTLCPYCAQDMDGLPLLTAYRSFFSGALQQQQQERKLLQRTLEVQFGERAQNHLSEIFTSHRSSTEWWRDAVGVQIDLPMELSAEEIIGRMVAVFTTVSAAVERKKENPSDQINLSEDELQVVTLWNDALTKLSRLLALVEEANVRVRQQKAAAGTVDVELLTRQLSTLNNQKNVTSQRLSRPLLPLMLRPRRRLVGIPEKLPPTLTSGSSLKRFLINMARRLTKFWRFLESISDW